MLDDWRVLQGRTRRPLVLSALQRPLQMRPLQMLLLQRPLRRLRRRGRSSQDRWMSCTFSTAITRRAVHGWCSGGVAPTRLSCGTRANRHGSFRHQLPSQMHELAHCNGKAARHDVSAVRAVHARDPTATPQHTGLRQRAQVGGSRLKAGPAGHVLASGMYMPVPCAMIAARMTVITSFQLYIQ